MNEPNYPNPADLREHAAKLEASAAAVVDSSEYPSVAKYAVAGQVAALKSYAETIESIGRPAPKRPGMTGEERRTRRADILRLRAARIAVKASQLHRTSHDIGAHIPFGQPILVGHHSERGHRRAIDRMHNATGAAIAADSYAADLERRADYTESHASINVSDSDAGEQYAAKLARLTAKRDNMKATNAAWRRYAKTKHTGELLALGFDGTQIENMELKIATAYSWEKQPFPKWQISNLGAVIRDTMKKAERAAKVATMPVVEQETDSGIKIEDNPADNRIRLFFPGKPDAITRSTLKRNGFRWTPSLGCWQAYRGWRASQIVAEIAGPAKPKAKDDDDAYSKFGL